MDYLQLPDGAQIPLPYEDGEALAQLLIQHLPEEQLTAVLRELNAHTA